MDPVTIATAVVGFLSPIVAKGLEDVAKSALNDAYAKIKDRFSKEPKNSKIIEQFEKDPSTGAEAFQTALVEQLKTDQDLMQQLVSILEKNKHSGALVNEVNAKNVVIAEKIDKIDMS